MTVELKADDENALKKVFDKYYNALYHYVLDKTGSPDISKDVVQLTFIKLWKYRHSLNIDIELSSQLFRIARTTLIDEVRRMNALRKTESKKYSGLICENTNESIVYNDTFRRLDILIAQMPPVRQKVFRLSRINNYSNKEIAEMLSISPKTVENHISLALKFLKVFFLLFFLICLMKQQ